MTRQQRLIVPLDGSELAEAALPYAEAVVQLLGGSLHLFAVIAPEPGGIFALAPEIRAQTEQWQCQATTAYLETLVRQSRERGVVADAETVVGNPTDEILAVAERQGATMVVMATHGRGGVQRLYLGSVADKVMRTAHQPTLLISPHEDTPARQPIRLRRIAVPLDGSPLAEAALSTATALATAAGARLMLVRMHSLPVTTTMAYPYVPELGAVEADLEQEARQYLEGVRQRLPAAITTKIAVLRGAPTVVLTDYLLEEGTDLVVMTTHGRGGFRRLIMGSTADRVVRLGLPVLLIRAAEQQA
jgi:nucleotide-binding universal stress UspA family protein